MRKKRNAREKFKRKEKTLVRRIERKKVNKEGKGE